MVSSEEAQLANWVCSALSLFILIGRFALSRLKQGSCDITHLICAVALVVVVVRLVVNQFVLSYGTSNDALNGPPQHFDAGRLEELKIGSILSLVARLLVTTFYWLQICLLLLFYSRIIYQVCPRWTAVTIRLSWVMIAVTYVAVVIVTFLECHPFSLYWQISPPPGTCIRAYAQLLTQGIANIVLDGLLLVISFPLLIIRNRTLSQKVRVGMLFSLGFFCIIITCIRIGYIYAEDSSQPVRSFWASVQMLVSCFVANVPTIYGCAQSLRRRKSEQQQRRGSRPELSLQIEVVPHHPDQYPVLLVPSRGSGSSGGAEKPWSRHVP